MVTLSDRTKLNESLILRYRENPSEDLANTFLKENEALVHFSIRKFYRLMPKDDLFAVGMMALYKSFLKFDPNKGYTFTTYAVKAIQSNVYHTINRKETKHRGLKSLDEEMFDNGKDDPILLKDALSDPLAQEDYENLIDHDYLKTLLKEATPKLSGNPKNFRVLENLLSERPVTQTQLSEELGVSQGHVSRMEIKIKNTLRNTHQLLQKK